MVNIIIYIIDTQGEIVRDTYNDIVSFKEYDRYLEIIIDENNKVFFNHDKVFHFTIQEVNKDDNN